MSGCEENEWGHGVAERNREARAKARKELEAYMEAWLEIDPCVRKVVIDHNEQQYLASRMKSPRPVGTDAFLIASDILRRIVEP